MVLSTTTFGILFILQHYPGGKNMLFIGIISLLILLVFLLIYKNKTTYKFYLKILKRILIIGGLGLLLIILPDLSFEKLQFRNHPDYIKALEEHLRFPDNKDLERKLELEYYKATVPPEEFEMYKEYIDNKEGNN